MIKFYNYLITLMFLTGIGNISILADAALSTRLDSPVLIEKIKKECEAPAGSKEAELCLAKIEQRDSTPTIELEPKAFSGKNIADKTIKFLTSLPDQFKLDNNKISYAIDHINKGLANLNIIKSGNETAIKKLQGANHNQKQYIDSIISLAWAFFANAVDKGQGFTGGTIVFKDPDHKIYNFLLEYVKRENPDVKAGKTEPKSSSTNCLAYSRHSSHFPELQKFERQFGIDIREGQKESLSELLPTRKQHILFGKYSTGYTFIKMEHFGLCSSDSSVRKHAWSWFTKRVVGRDSGISRKEDMKFNKTITKILTDFAKNKHVQDLCKNNKLEFIRDYYNCASSLKKSTNKDVMSLGNKFITDLSQHLDNLAIRRGNEVIILD